ncbi:MAG: PAS domain-containing sensor histidine kinase [Bacteroidia bacterium]
MKTEANNTGIREQIEKNSLGDPSFYKTAISQIKDYGIFMLSPEGYVATWNPGAQRLKGYSEDEIIGRHFSVFFTEEDNENAKPIYELNVAIQDGKFEDEGWRVKKDGLRFWASVNITPVFIEKKLMGFVKVTRDFTQRKMTEEMIREAKDRYKLLLDETMDYAIFLLDTKGRVATWNIGAQRIKGYKAEEIIGKHFSTFYTKEAKDSHYPDYELKKAEEDGRYEDEGWRIKKDGSLFWANVVITALFREGKLIGFSKLTRDITEKKRAQEEAKQKEEIEANKTKLINEELSRFAHVVAHDLRAPLRAIGAYSKRAIEHLDKNASEEVTANIEKINVNITKMNNIIDGLLSYTQISKGQQLKTTIDVEKFINNLSSVINLDKNVSLTFKTRLPEVVYSEPLLRQIFDNLITNAVKYNDKEHIEIEIGCKEIKSVWRFCVKDNGMGIEKKYFDKIFEMFETLGDKQENSTGIGLAIVKKAVESQNGKIWVESEKGKGTTFYFTIPKQEGTSINH